MSGEEVEHEILGKKIIIPSLPDPPVFSWEEDRKTENKTVPKPSRRRFVRKK